MLARVGAAREPLVLHQLTDVARPLAQTRDPIDDIHHEMEPVKVVQHDHVEERIDGRLCLARPIGGGPLSGLIDRADTLLDGRARAAVRDGSLGYGVTVARRLREPTLQRARSLGRP